MNHNFNKFISLLLFSPINSLIFLLITILSGFTNSLIALSLFPLLRELDKNSVSSSFILDYFDSFLLLFGINPSLSVVLIFMITVVIITAIIDIFFELFSQMTCAKLRYNLSINLFNKVLNSNWSYFREKKPGEIINSIFPEIQKTVAAYKDILELMSFVSQFFFYIFFSFLISFEITLSTIIVGFIIVLFFLTWNKKAKIAGFHYNNVSKSLTSIMLETLKNIKTIKASGKSNLLVNFFNQDFINLKEKEYIMNTILVYPKKLAPVFIYIFLALGVYIIYIYNLFSFAELVPLIFLYTRTVVNITNVQNKYQSIKKQESFYDSYLGNLKLAENLKEVNTGKEDPVFSDNIKFKNIYFSYGTKKIFNDLNIKIKKNTFNIILGKSGNGKTTFLDLICQIIKPNQGKILVDEKNILSFDINKWRNLIGYVSQENTFYNDTLKNNLTLKNKNISISKINEVIELCELSELISNMENGIDTVIGEEGSKISGGQRQRLSIARAMINSPQILILDESTNSLDKQTKIKLIKRLKEKTRVNLTVIMTTHDTSFAEHADTVLEVKNFGIHE